MPLVHVFLAFLLLLPAFAAGQQQQFAIRDYTLRTLLDEALSQDSFGGQYTESFESRRQEKEAAAKQALRPVNPELGVSVGQKTAGSAQGSAFELSVSQVIPSSRKTELRSRVLAAESLDAALRQRNARQGIIEETVRAAYRHETNRRRKEIAETRLRRLAVIDTFLSGNLFPSPQQRTERQIVKNRLTRVAQDRRSAESDFQSSRRRLAAFLLNADEVDPHSVLPRPSGLKPLDPAELAVVARENNPGLGLQRLAAGTAMTQQSLAEAETALDYTVSGFFSREEAGTTDQTIGVGIAVPLPFRNRNEDGIRGAKLRVLAESQLLRAEEKRTEALLSAAFIDYEGARRAAGQYPQADLEEMDRTFLYAEEEFTKGRVGMVQLLELEEQVAEAHFYVTDSELALALRRLELLGLAGAANIADYFAER